MLYRIPAKYQQISQQGRQDRLQELAEKIAAHFQIRVRQHGCGLSVDG